MHSKGENVTAAEKQVTNLLGAKTRIKPKEEWAINKAQSHAHAHAQANTYDTSKVTSVNSNNPPSSQASQQANVNQFGWTGVHMKLQFYQASEMRDWILLDNQSSVTVFCNPKMVENI